MSWQRFLFDEVWVAVLKGDYANVIPITMTWALKQKASGVVRARCNVRGFEQIPHIHYDPDSKSSPVTKQAAVFIVFTLLMMNVDYGARILDVKGAFL
jgi:Reverse transcriptase (RNA-dependent DNA polymerase)